MQSVLVMFVADLYPSGFQQPSENPTRLFVCVNACACVCVCVCWKGVTALLIMEVEECCFKQLCVCARVCVCACVMGCASRV